MVVRLKIVCLLFLLGCSSVLYSQSLVSYVSVNHTEAYIGQPIQMTVSVYTSTWFTAGVDLGNIQVEGALTVYFRSVPNRRTFSGKEYPGVDFIYNLFPTQEGDITIPQLEIHVESPKVGGYKGIKHVLHTKPKTITVKPVPPGYNPNNWLVSSNLTVHENWNPAIKDVKVGDVLQRTISRNASGTLGEFIPAVIWDSVPGVSIYPKRPGVNTHKAKTYVSASRQDGANYLFEKEGEVTLPRLEFVYWNYNNRKFYKKVIDSVTINVAANPDLNMLAGIKKQLEAETATVPEEDKPFLILGLTVKQFLEYLILGILLLYILYKLLPWGIKRVTTYYKKYHVSEQYVFRQVVHSLKQKQGLSFFNALSAWRLKLVPKYQDLELFINEFGTSEFKVLYNKLKQITFNNDSTKFDYSTFLNELKVSRKTYLSSLKEPKIKSKNWLNPIKEL